MELYFHLAECTGDNDKHLFISLSHPKSRYRLRLSGSSNCTRVQELVLERIKAIGLDPRQLDFISGGTLVAANAGVPDRWFKP